MKTFRFTTLQGNGICYVGNSRIIYHKKFFDKYSKYFNIDQKEMTLMNLDFPILYEQRYMTVGDSKYLLKNHEIHSIKIPKDVSDKMLKKIESDYVYENQYNKILFDWLKVNYPNASKNLNSEKFNFKFHRQIGGYFAYSYENEVYIGLFVYKNIETKPIDFLWGYKNKNIPKTMSDNIINTDYEKMKLS